METRKAYLCELLEANGLTLQSDSELCRDYIERGDSAKISDPLMIVQRMCEAHYLHHYANSDLGYALAKGIVTYYIGQAVDRRQWKEMVRKCCLLTMWDVKFPTKSWPWIEEISIEEWKKHTDRTEDLLNPIQRPLTASEAKFLSEYTNPKLGQALARGIVNFYLRVQRVDPGRWKAMVRECTLLTTKETTFPREDEWPWQNQEDASQSPEVWRLKNDRTLALT